MGTINVTCSIRSYPDELKPEYTYVTIRSHWKSDRKILIQIGEGTSVTCEAAELIKAIQNATNSKAY